MTRVIDGDTCEYRGLNWKFSRRASLYGIYGFGESEDCCVSAIEYDEDNHKITGEEPPSREEMMDVAINAHNKKIRIAENTIRELSEIKT